MSPIAISPQASYCHCDVILIITRSPRSHYDVILIVTSSATELVTPTVTDVRTSVRTDTLPRLIYKDADKVDSLPVATTYISQLQPARIEDREAWRDRT